MQKLNIFATAEMVPFGGALVNGLIIYLRDFRHKNKDSNDSRAVAVNLSQECWIAPISFLDTSRTSNWSHSGGIMSKRQRYMDESKLAAVKQVTERNYPVAEIAEQIGASNYSHYT